MARTCVRKPLVRAWWYPAVAFAAALLALTLLSTPANAAPTGPQLRAAVIVAILRFTSWQSSIPKADDARVNLCTIGKPYAEPYLLPVNGEQTVAGRNLLVRELEVSAVANSDCNALVVGGRLSTRELAAVLAQADEKAMLTICDGCRSAAAMDTIIQLELHKQRVRFEVNLAKARANGIMLDAQLLELASAVRK